MERTKQNIPALNIKCNGKNLIEASAGTGKTWTLTGILLRLLLEAKFSAREIVATTFTRKAAAEMRERIYKKMQSLLNLARFLAQEKESDLEFWQDDGEFKTRLENLLNSWADNEEIKQDAKDIMNQYLFLHFADNLDNFITFLANCDEVEKSLNDIFIGTFDSLCQKWLKEFALETGSSNNEKLLDNELLPIQNLIHKNLRDYYYQNQNKEEFLKTVINSKIDSKKYAQAIKDNLSFFKADFSISSENLQDEISKEIWVKVKEQLPSYLERRGETIFSEQIAKLNRVLEKNPNLAKFIAHKYPVILVDESQDLNKEQTELLEKIYLTDNNLPDRGFFMPVGDPKQAIYLFRGGDVYNYNNLKDYFTEDKIFSLNKSYRTTKNLIEKLNLIYQTTPKNKEPYFGKDINYQIMSAAENEAEVFELGNVIQEPILSFESETPEDEQVFISELVFNLLSKKSRFHRKINGENYQLKASDILILTKNHNDLNNINQFLEKRGIKAQVNSKDNYLFAHEIPKILESLFSAFLEPHNSSYQHFLVNSLLFNGEVEENLNYTLIQAGDLWRTRGLAAAFNYFCSEMKIWTKISSLGDSYNEKIQTLLDLRQISQILPDFSRHLLPQEILEKWREFLRNPAQAGYKAEEIENENCVQLMTQHGAKGLEAPIVIVAGLKNSHKSSKAMFKTFFDNEKNQRIIYPKSKTELDMDKTSDAQSIEESSRLLYVALTRARELLFIAKRKKFKNGKEALNALNSLNVDNKTKILTTADEVLGDIELKSYPSLTFRTEENFQEAKLQTSFQGWRKSSFSALVSNAKEANVAIESKDFELENPEEGELVELIDTEQLDMQFRFPKGAKAGSFLHKVLETFPIEEKSKWERQKFINQLRLRFALSTQSQAKDPENKEILHWIENILISPLISDAKLAYIPKERKACEMSFTLLGNAETNFPVEKINKLFKKWGKKFALKDFSSHIAFLRGEIDLCYEQQGRYYIVDYKSNFLGTKEEDYVEAKMIEAMNHHGYWLQALIYQTALHRHLKNRLKNYDMDKNLAPVEYFFLRGVKKNTNYGHLKIEIPNEIVQEFDELIQGVRS